MAIQDYMNTDFTYQIRTEEKVGGRNKMVYTQEGNTYKCAIFTPATQKTVRFGKQDFIISKTLYTDITISLNLGDIVTVDGIDFDVVSKVDTNNIGHHITVGLVSRES